ncbi:MAG: site-specific integrase [Candidatus Korobacteraceae bacterium]
MARRRYQNPAPWVEGNWWYIKVRQDDIVNGERKRVQKRVRLAPATAKLREVQKLRDEHLRPMNQGLQTVGSATAFATYVQEIYMPTEMPLLASSSQSRYAGVIKNYLLPVFGKSALRDIGTLQAQTYFASLGGKGLQHASQHKIRTVLAAVLGSAVKYRYLVKTPMDGVRLAPQKMGRRVTKPNITFAQFEDIISRMQEPYATMVYVAVFSGLRISELIGLRWEDVWEFALNVDERCCRGDWSQPKSEASNAAVPVPRHVIERIHRLKLLTVDGKCGHAVRKYKLVKSDGPGDLVFQSVRQGKPMRDNNILVRHIKPAARAAGIKWVNWRCLRTSYGTWQHRAGVAMKDIQGNMRHSRMSTTADIYVQDIPESRRRAVDSLPVPRLVN